MQPNIHDAVRALYSNAVTIYGNDVNSLIVHDVNGSAITIDESAVTNQLTTLQTNYETEQTSQANNKASALSKLAALGLTADEISALVG